MGWSLFRNPWCWILSLKDIILQSWNHFYQKLQICVVSESRLHLWKNDLRKFFLSKRYLFQLLLFLGIEASISANANCLKDVLREKEKMRKTAKLLICQPFKVTTFSHLSIWVFEAFEKWYLCGSMVHGNYYDASIKMECTHLNSCSTWKNLFLFTAFSNQTSCRWVFL